MVNNWNDQLISLSKIAEMEPQAAYAAFIEGFKSKFLYFLQTIPDIHEYFQPTEVTISNELIPAISGLSSILNVNSYHYQRDMGV